MRKSSRLHKSTRPVFVEDNRARGLIHHCPLSFPSTPIQFRLKAMLVLYPMPLTPLEASFPSLKGLAG